MGLFGRLGVCVQCVYSGYISLFGALVVYYVLGFGRRMGE